MYSYYLDINYEKSSFENLCANRLESMCKVKIDSYQIIFNTLTVRIKKFKTAF